MKLSKRKAKLLAARVQDAGLEVEAARLFLLQSPEPGLAWAPIEDAIAELRAVLEELEADR